MRFPFVAFAIAFTLAACAEDDPATVDPRCAACTADQLCVQFLDGPCGTAAVTCVAKATGCETGTCSAACDTAYCGSGASTCSAPSCPDDIAGAYHCYGP